MLDLPPTQRRGKWRFIGIPYYESSNSAGDWNPGWGVDLKHTENIIKSGYPKLVHSGKLT